MGDRARDPIGITESASKPKTSSPRAPVRCHRNRDTASRWAEEETLSEKRTPIPRYRVGIGRAGGAEGTRTPDPSTASVAWRARLTWQGGQQASPGMRFRYSVRTVLRRFVLSRGLSAGHMKSLAALVRRIMADLVESVLGWPSSGRRSLSVSDLTGSRERLLHCSEIRPFRK